MLIFEKSRPGRGCDLLPECDVEVTLPQEKDKREKKLHLPELSEIELSRHYTELAKKSHGVNDGFYPLGSCTMKYNPKINEDMAALPGFTEIHPLQPTHTVQGCLEVIKESENLLCEITGMDRMTFQPAAGAHGEFTGLLLIKAYHKSRGDEKRKKIIVPDSAHGTNPASAAMAGFQVVSIESAPDGGVDLEKLQEVCGEDTAGLMLTNPNTVGLFDKNILKITEIVHNCGGLCYYDGANLNAVMGTVCPGDMGFDVIHLNLHKTFSTPHGGGGPGSGPVGCKSMLVPFLPSYVVDGEEELKFVKESETATKNKSESFSRLLNVGETATAITDADGKITWENLDQGDYEIRETKTVDGCALLTDVIKVTLPLQLTKDEADSYGNVNKDLAKEDTNYTKKWYFFDCKYEIKNNQVFLMPMTGSDGTWMYGFVGFAAIAFTGCLYLLLDEKKKNKRKHRRKRR